MLYNSDLGYGEAAVSEPSRPPSKKWLKLNMEKAMKLNSDHALKLKINKEKGERKYVTFLT